MNKRPFRMHLARSSFRLSHILVVSVVLFGLIASSYAQPPAAGADNKGLLAVKPGASRISGTQHNWLIAVGINRFKDTGVNPLQYAVADARDLHAFFSASGFVPPTQAYLLVTDAEREDRRPTRVNILKALQYAANNATAQSTIIFSFSGHGFTDDASKDSREKPSYLLPEDGDLDLLNDTAVAVARVNDILKNSNAARKLVFADACRDIPKRSSKGASGPAASAAFLEALKASAGQVTLASCNEGESSLENDQLGHGVFTYYLLQGLRGAAQPNKDGLITHFALQEYVAGAVPGWCRENMKKPQQPWMSGAASVPIPLSVAGANILPEPPLAIIPKPVTPKPATPKPQEEASASDIVKRSSDGRFTVSSNGVIRDTTTKLEWCVGPDKDTNYDDAYKWVSNLSTAGGSWRMPIREELKALHQKGKGDRNMDPVFETTGWWVWAEDQPKDSSAAWDFGYPNGTEPWHRRSNSGFGRVFAVRSGR